MTCKQILTELPVLEQLVEQLPELIVDTEDAGGTVVDAAENELLVDDTPDLLVVEEDQRLVILDVGQQGPPGPPGEAGGAALSLIAGAALGGHRAVRSLAGVAVYADCETLADAALVLGITQGAASEGAPVFVQTSGLMTEPSWSWTPDLPVFVGFAGVLTQTPPAIGYRLIVGVATRADQIHIGLKMPIVLE